MRSFLIAMFTLSCLLGTPAEAQRKTTRLLNVEKRPITPMDIVKVLKLVDNPENPGYKKNDQGTRIVFVLGTIRYTFYHLLKWADGKPLNRLLIYASVRHTEEKQEGNTFADDGYDGTVDFGSSYTITKDKDRQPEPKEFDAEKKQGEEHRAVYQTLYDEVIKAALHARGLH